MNALIYCSGRQKIEAILNWASTKPSLYLPHIESIADIAELALTEEHHKCLDTTIRSFDIQVEVWADRPLLN